MLCVQKNGSLLKRKLLLLWDLWICQKRPELKNSILDWNERLSSFPKRSLPIRIRGKRRRRFFPCLEQFRSNWPGIEPELCHFPSNWLGVSHLIFLPLPFLSYQYTNISHWSWRDSRGVKAHACLSLTLVLSSTSQAPLLLLESVGLAWRHHVWPWKSLVPKGLSNMILQLNTSWLVKNCQLGVFSRYLELCHHSSPNNLTMIFFFAFWATPFDS